MNKIIIYHSIFFLISITLSYCTFEVVVYSDIRNFLVTLQVLSAAVFTLAGIWVAYIYPEAIAVFTNPKDVSLLKGSERTERVEELVLTILVSAFVLLSTILIFLSEAIFKNTNFVQNNANDFMFLIVTSTVMLTTIQSKAMLTIMVNNIKFVNELYNKKIERQANDDL